MFATTPGSHNIRLWHCHIRFLYLLQSYCFNQRRMSQYPALALLIYISIPTSSYRFIERRMLQYRASALLPYISIPTSKLLFK